jgi:hypothetical protein
MLGYGHFVTLAAKRHGMAPPRRGVGDVIGVIWPYVSVSEIEKLDAKIIHLHTDIMALSIKAPPDGSTPEVWTEHLMAQRRLAAFHIEWTAYRSAWDVWKRDHYGEIARTGDGTRQEFDDLRSSYNEWLRRFKATWGGQTEVKPAESEAGKESPVEKGLDALTWISIAVVAGVGFYAYKQTKE